MAKKKQDKILEHETPAQRLSGIIKSCRNTMRKDKGMNGDGDRLPMLTWIMFLKFLDDNENLQETQASLKNKKYKAAIEEPYRWRDWAKDKNLTGDDLLSFINNEKVKLANGKERTGLLYFLRGLQSETGSERKDVIATVFKGVTNKMINGYLLRDVINKIDEIHFTNNEETNTLSHLYESILKEMRDASGDAGEFYTPRPVVKFMVEMLDPKIGETILDPASGTGGFLVASFEHLKKQAKTIEHQEFLQNKSIIGGEAKPLPYLLCQMNLLLHGLNYPNIDSRNSLRKPLRDIGDNERVDIILTNPPFGGEEEKGILNNFPDDKKTSETALLFLQLIMRKLKKKKPGKVGGRAAIVVPHGTLFAPGIAARVKKQLIDEFNLHTIVRLGEGIFAPYTDIPCNLLFFEQGEPTKEIWYYELLPPDERKKYSKTKPMQFEEFDKLKKWWKTRKENDNAWRVKIKDVLINDAEGKLLNVNLDLKNPNRKGEKANFLISSIVTAKNYRDDVAVKFLYPITEANQSPNKIGQRGLKLPVQFINSSVIPIIKEDKLKISFLLFCSDSFSQDTLKKLIWLTIRLSSGFGNEYILFFPDYNEVIHGNDASEVIRSFNEELLDQKIKILRYNRIDAEALDSLIKTEVTINKDEKYNESNDEQALFNSKHLNATFINILPFGDILKPFLVTDAITANDLKIFLAKKGIFFKSADKNRLISFMSTLIFSPNELENFKSLIEIKDRSLHTTNEIFNIRQNNSLESIFKQINPNFDNLTEGLNTKIITPNISFIKNHKNNDEFVLSLTTELKDPTSQISVNTTWGKTEILVRKESDKIIIVTENTITREDKLIANRALKLIYDEFSRVGFIEEEKIKVMFNKFGSNSERVNFLLSFSNIASSSIFKEADIQSIKFKFDENTEIPEFYKDKADKDLVINFEGRGLKTLTELSQENAKDAIFLEEMRILYKFDYLNLKNGLYKVTYNFSNALRNKLEKDGIFKSEPYLMKTNNVKSLSNIDSLEKELAKEIEKIKLEKLKQFNIIE